MDIKIEVLVLSEWDVPQLDALETEIRVSAANLGLFVSTSRLSVNHNEFSWNAVRDILELDAEANDNSPVDMAFGPGGEFEFPEDDDDMDSDPDESRDDLT